MKLVLLSNSPIRLSTPKYFSWGQDALWFPTPLLSLEFSQTFCQVLSPCSLPLGHPDYHSMRWQHPWLFPCSTGAQQSSPLSIHLSHLAGRCIAMGGMPTLIRKTHYDPCSQAKIGGTLRQLDKRNVYCSIRNLSVQMAGILLQTEIDSCQTKVSVPVNTELRFPSSTWHDYMLTKRKLDNQKWELGDEEKKTNCFILQHGIAVKAYCASGEMPKSDECAAGECWSERARMLETCQPVDRSVCPRLERESLCQTNMRTVYHRVSTQNGTGQCHDSTNNIWRRETEARWVGVDQ